MTTIPVSDGDTLDGYLLLDADLGGFAYIPLDSLTFCETEAEAIEECRFPKK